MEAVFKYAGEEYNIKANIEDLQLLHIFILFEQNEDELYGLEFRIEFDVEHGCGLKITGSDYEIIEIGTGDVSFC